MAWLNEYILHDGFRVVMAWLNICILNDRFRYVMSRFIGYLYIDLRKLEEHKHYNNYSSTIRQKHMEFSSKYLLHIIPLQHYNIKSLTIRLEYGYYSHISFTNDKTRTRIGE